MDQAGDYRRESLSTPRSGFGFIRGKLQHHSGQSYPCRPDRSRPPGLSREVADLYVPASQRELGQEWLADLGALPQVVGDEEGGQSLGEGDRRLFGHMVPGVDAVPGQVMSPVPPDGQRVSMEFFEVVVF